MGRVIGIDLGTTNCCVAVMEGHTPAVIANKQGYTTTPSIVGIAENGKRVVGQLAARQAITNAEHTVYATKRLIGRQFDSPQVLQTQQTVPFKIVQGPYNDVRIELRRKQYSIPEISAMLLQEMRVIAEEYLQEEVDQAVITVPAYFNDAQRQAVRDAGLIAGLDVLRIINEPTAAALAYGFHRSENRTLAVYDLGGGTFDISIVQVTEGGVFRVIATTGDSFLGGEDFDARIMAWLIRGFQVQEDVNLRTSPVALQRLKQAAQTAKCELSEIETTEIQLPFIHDGVSGPLNMHYAITRAQLEKLTRDLVERTLFICERAMQIGNLEKSDIDEVVLVGGMTRMPLVQTQVADFFGRVSSKGVHPDEVVALGAAIQGAALAHEIDEVSLEDVTAHALGIATAGDHFDVIIPGNTRVPCRVPSLFTTSRDDQDRVKIVVLQGESTSASDNDFLQEFALTSLRRAPAGELEIEVAFGIDEDGIFSVSAKDMETGEETYVEITGDSMGEEELDRMSSESTEYLEERRAEEASERMRQGVHTLISDLERMFPDAERWAAGNPMHTLTITHARHATVMAGSALMTGSRGELAEQLVTLEDAKSMLEKLLQESDGQRR
ncbi:MAG: molecular chaperone DnaK [Polyangiales bacterium]|jgi:molecular chaperone DnaK